MLLLFFEIEIVPLYAIYLVYILPALIGCALGVARWWLGTIWLAGPLALVVAGYALLQHEEINYFYDHVIRREGYWYIAHNIAAPIGAVVLNLIGIGVGFIRRVEITGNNDYANTESIGRI